MICKCPSFVAVPEAEDALAVILSTVAGLLGDTINPFLREVLSRRSVCHEGRDG